MRCWRLLAFLFTITIAHAQDAPLGARIGPTLDAGERAYFGLFPHVDEPPPYGFRIEDDLVHVTHDGLIVLSMPRSDADHLAALIATFEDYPTVVANPDWKANAAFVEYIDGRTPVAYPRSGQLVRAITPDGVYAGYVLYTTDSLIVLAPEVPIRDGSLPGAYTIPVSAVQSVDRAYAHRWERWGPVLGGAVGALLGGGLVRPEKRGAAAAFGGLFGATVVDAGTRRVGRGRLDAGPEALVRVAYFNDVRPPELPAPSVAVSLAGRPRPTPQPLPRRPRAHEWVSIGIHGGVLTEEADSAPVPTLEAVTILPVESEYGPMLVPAGEALSTPYRIDLSVRPLLWVRLGAYVGEATTGDSTFYSPGHEQLVRSYGPVRPYAEAILPVRLTARQRVEVSVGGGRESYRIRAVQQGPTTVNGWTTPLVSTDVSDEGTAWFYHVGAEIYASPHTSLFVRHAWHPLPSLDVEELTSRWSHNQTQVVRYVPEHNVDFSYREITIGTRFHL